MLPRTTSIWQRDSQPTASGKPGAVQLIRKKLGEERYDQLIDLAARAKALFAADQNDDNGKTDEGRELLCQMQDVLRDVRRGRAKAQLSDEEGEVTGDRRKIANDLIAQLRLLWAPSTYSRMAANS